jgi:hypothetical protein
MGCLMGFEPTISRSTNWRFKPLSYRHQKPYRLFFVVMHQEVTIMTQPGLFGNSIVFAIPAFMMHCHHSRVNRLEIDKLGMNKKEPRISF